ncbi:hypothetical protein DMUE_0779 [Dictyocoela muelleri]|nr:hypothetical protein DMUE_0779 [Dictyocoela muelleri]
MKKKLLLSERKRIAIEINGKGYKIADLISKYGITRSVAKSIVKNIVELSAVKDGEFLEGRKNISNIDSKYLEIDVFLLKKIKILRSKNIAISQNNLLKLADEFYKIQGQDKKSTIYFIKNFIKRQNLSFINLHGESASADLSKIEQFKDELSQKMLSYEKKRF